MQSRNKGISIVFIPSRGRTRTYHMSPLILYLVVILLFITVFFSFQFFSRLHQLKLTYLAISSFSEEEKQRLLSDELSVIQDQLVSINTIHQSNKAMVDGITSMDKEARKKISLRENKLQFAINPKNQRISNVNLSLDPASIYEFYEDILNQNKELKERTRTLDIAHLAADDFIAEDKKTPEGYPYGSAYNISPGYGYRIHPIFRTVDYHTGVDISVPHGYGLKATGDGKVVEAGWSGGYGYMVKLYHRNGIESLYAHCSQILVKVGDYVKRGDIIAKGGATGTATNSHVHYEIIMNNKKVDPQEFNRAISKVKAK